MGYKHGEAQVKLELNLFPQRTIDHIEVIGYEKFVEYANDCGVDGVLLVDLPPEEAQDFDNILKKYE